MQKNRKTQKIVYMILFVVSVIAFSGAVSAATLDVGPSGSGHAYTSINAALTAASNGDTIIVYDNSGASYTYTENLDIDGKSGLNFTAAGNVTVSASNANNPTFNVRADNTIIQGFTIQGATGSTIIGGDSAGVRIRNKANGTIILNNIITANRVGVYISSGILGSSGTSTIQGNLIINNNDDGIRVSDGNNKFINNTITENEEGLHIIGGSNNITGNNITENDANGIRILAGQNTIVSNHITENDDNGIRVDAVADTTELHFNRIVDNTRYGLYVTSGNYVNAQNNWWGTNSPTYVKNLLNPPADGTNIYEQRSNLFNPRVAYSPWLVLKIKADPTSIYNGQTSNVTAYLTDNSNGQDTSALGHIPDGTPVHFTLLAPVLGTINPTDLGTINGTANTIFTANTVGIQLVTSTVDHQTLGNPVEININPAAHVVLTKTADNPTPNYWQLITFNITAHNNGPNTATGLQITDILPAGLTYVSSNPSGTTTYNPVTGIWDIGTLIFGIADATLDITANVTSTGLIINWANVTAQTTYDPQPFNNTNTTINVPLSADISVTKFFYDEYGIDEIVFPGNPAERFYNISTRIIVVNNGPDTATNVVITDLFGPGLSLAEVYPGPPFYPSIYSWFVVETSGGFFDEFNPSFDPATMTWTIPSINAGPDNFWLLDIITLVNATGIVNNTATFDPATADQYDWNSTNDVGYVNTYVPTAQTQLSKWYQNDSTYGSPHISTANYLQNIYAFIKLYNVGPDTAQSITIIDDFTNNLIYNSSLIETSYDGGLTWNTDPNVYWLDFGTYFELEWFPNDLTSSAMALFRIPAQINASSIIITNNASETQRTFNPDGDNSYNPPITEPGFNTINATTTLDVADAAHVTLTKTADNPTPNYWQLITFTITAHNNGPNTATSVQVTDILPAGLTYVSSDPGYNSATGIWDILSLTNGADAVMHITANVTGTGLITNWANVNAQTTYDPQPFNNTTTTINVADAAHVTLTKTSSNPTPNYWQLVTFTITAHNNGPNTADGVQITDILPASLTYVSSNPSGTTTYNPVTGIWDIGTLIFGGADATLDIIANVTSTGNITNWANVTGQTTYDPLPFNSTSLTLNVPSAAALELTKTVNNNSPKVHDTIIYTLIVQNHGPNAATSVNVTDVLPLGGLTFVGVDSVDYGSYANGVWTIGDLPANTVAHLVLRFTVDRAGTIENMAKVTSLTFDPELYPRSALVTINAQAQPVSEVNAKTIAMQKTGAPIGALILAVLMVLGGMVLPKRKN